MKTVSVAEAKNNLSKLLARVGAGEEISVTRYGKPVAQLVAAKSEESPKAQQANVRRVFQKLRELRRGVRLEGDLKAIARDGLVDAFRAGQFRRLRLAAGKPGKRVHRRCCQAPRV